MPVLQSAHSQGKDNAQAQLRLAEQLRQAGRFDEAAARIQAVIEARADFAAAHNNLGLVWFSKQDYRPGDRELPAGDPHQARLRRGAQ